ncbi:MAG: ankyrin repeat domain-containing protein [Trueperaceae bacterium]|nr:ankyrin repeat domain-containing protein [Trueperaceae bacterium]
MIRTLAAALALVALVLIGVWQLGWLAPSSQEPPPDASASAEALFVAAEDGDVEGIAEALAGDAAVGARDAFGRTALMIAAAGGHDDAVMSLLEAGADPNARADDGKTPLMIAAEEAPSARTVLLLLNAGGDPLAQDEAGERALDLARGNAAVRGSGLWSRLEELTEGFDDLAELTGAPAFDPEWPAGYVVPVDGATLSSRANHLPGAPRAYRNGTHEGFDFYDGTVSVEIGYGTEQRAAAPGEVIRADVNYQELTPEGYDEVIERATASLDTPPEVLDTLRGRQVWIRHAGGFVTRYAHLSAIPEGITEGTSVRQGTIIGLTGNSGTLEGATGTEDEPHPHVEVWRGNDRYLGQNMEPAEIYARAAQVFGLSALPPFTDTGLTF